MSVDDDKKEIAQLERVNAELSQSLARCRALLHDCKSKLAANSNEPRSAVEDEDKREG